MPSPCSAAPAPGTIPHTAPPRKRWARVWREAGIRLVYGGGRIGLMGVVADAALAAGGAVLGVIPEFLTRREVAHDGLDRAGGHRHHAQPQAADVRGGRCVRDAAGRPRHAGRDDRDHHLAAARAARQADPDLRRGRFGHTVLAAIEAAIARRFRRARRRATCSRCWTASRRCCGGWRTCTARRRRGRRGCSGALPRAVARGYMRRLGRSVAQPGRALCSGRRGRRFESSHSDQPFHDMPTMAAATRPAGACLPAHRAAAATRRPVPAGRCSSA